MSPDRDPDRREDEGYNEEYEVESRRSIFSALWFRALLALLALGVLAAVAVPYVLDFAMHQTAKRAQPKPLTAATPPAPTPSSQAPTAAPVVTPPSAPTAAPAATASSPSRTAAPAATASSPSRTAAPATPKMAAASKPSAPSPAKTVDAPPAGGSYWVQVGAFKDPEAAARLVTRLRAGGMRVEQTTTNRGARATAAPSAESPPDRYHVVVSGGAAGDVDAKLAAKGLTSEATPAGAVVQPSLPLREAVALSRELADAGLIVQVRRVASAAPASSAGGGETLHRVRAGGFPDRASAVAVLKQLEAKGYKPFIARGNE